MTTPPRACFAAFTLLSHALPPPAGLFLATSHFTVPALPHAPDIEPLKAVLGPPLAADTRCRLAQPLRHQKLPRETCAAPLCRASPPLVPRVQGRERRQQSGGLHQCAALVCARACQWDGRWLGARTRAGIGGHASHETSGAMGLTEAQRRSAPAGTAVPGRRPGSSARRVGCGGGGAAGGGAPMRDLEPRPAIPAPGHPQVAQEQCALHCRTWRAHADPRQMRGPGVSHRGRRCATASRGPP